MVVLADPIVTVNPTLSAIRAFAEIFPVREKQIVAARESQIFAEEPADQIQTANHHFSAMKVFAEIHLVQAKQIVPARQEQPQHRD